EPKARQQISAFIFPDLLQRSAYTLSAAELAGVRCWRLEGQAGTAGDAWAFRDRWWLDPGKGYTPLRREGFDHRSGRLLWHNTYADLREVAPGCWLPMQATAEDYGPPYVPAELAKKPLRVVRSRVTRGEVNNVADDLVEYQFPKGTRVADLPRP